MSSQSKEVQICQGFKVDKTKKKDLRGQQGIRKPVLVGFDDQSRSQERWKIPIIPVAVESPANKCWTAPGSSDRRLVSTKLESMKR